MPAASITLDEALDLARTGDVWLFRGRAMADRAIQVATNSPVNHVGMSVVIEDLPPLMWHAELGRSLPDVWAGARHRRSSCMTCVLPSSSTPQPPALGRSHIHVSREPGSGRAGRRGTTTFMTLTRLVPGGRVRLRYGAITAPSSSPSR